MKVTFYGTRGTYPIPGTKFTKYGGHTPCICIEKTVDGVTHQIIIDAGTGIIKYGKNASGPEFHLFLTHYHFDHIQGIPFFEPIYKEGNTVNFYGFSHHEKDLKNFFEDFVSDYTFPIPLSDMKAKKQYHPLSTGESREIGPLTITSYHSLPTNHPKHGAIYYKITDTLTGKSVCCLFDYEQSQDDKDIIEFCRDTNVLIHDTFFTKEEYDDPNNQFKGYGHCHFLQAIETAKKANIKDSLICFHYNTTHTDLLLDTMKERLPKDNHFDIIFSTEEMELMI